jgi:hypothetical protein
VHQECEKKKPPNIRRLVIPLFFGTFVPHIEQLPLFKAPWPFGSVAGVA